VVGKGGGRVNMVQKMCTHECICKNDACWNYSRNWERRGKRAVEGANSSMMYLLHCKNLGK
jgi:hypothetical protein